MGFNSGFKGLTYFLTEIINFKTYFCNRPGRKYPRTVTLYLNWACLCNYTGTILSDNSQPFSLISCRDFASSAPRTAVGVNAFYSNILQFILCFYSPRVKELEIFCFCSQTRVTFNKCVAHCNSNFLKLSEPMGID
jgi:hypothetical protein